MRPRIIRQGSSFSRDVSQLHHWFLIISVLLSLSMGISCRSIDPCGVSPSDHRVLKGSDFELDLPDRPVWLEAIYRTGNGSRIVLRVADAEEVRWVESYDGGTSWSYCERPGWTNIRQFGDPRMMFGSSADAAVAYERIKPRHFREPEGVFYRVTRDVGRTWNDITPILQPEVMYNDTLIRATSPRMAGRVYASFGWDYGERALFISEDYGYRFRLLSKDLAFVEESQARDGTLFGLANTSTSGFLMISSDSGKTWENCPAAQELFTPVYRDRISRRLRTWRQESHDDELPILRVITQILSDAGDPKIFYINTFKGLFRSVDLGREFVLLPLEMDKIENIPEVAADPIRSGALYAVVGRRDLYRSYDYGCTWNRLQMPGH
jgi:hypothetical protein